MRKIKIDDILIERIKYVLDEIEDALDLGGLDFEEYWKNLTKREIIESAITEPNYYDYIFNLEPLEDFYKMQKIKYNEKDNTIDFESNNYANIFLKRIYYESNEILRIERREKLEQIACKT